MSNIVISKNGQEIGPFTLEAARSLVLAGQVSPNDWATFDGAKDWVPLNQVPGFLSGTSAKPEKPAKTKHVTTELTSKNLKAQTVLSALLLIVGIIMTFAGPKAGEFGVSNFCGVALIPVALIWLFVTKLRIWWNHS